MSEYLAINIFVIIVPLLMSFEKQIKFYRNLPALLFSILVVGGTFIVWDAIAAVRGDWSFNPDYVLAFRFYNLPLEEILFFVTVPYASIFLYETANVYLKNKQVNLRRRTFAYLSILFLLLAALFNKQYYTATVLGFMSVFMLLVFIANPKFIRELIYWKWIFFTYVPFLTVNYFLTSLPIISYSPKAIWGIKITTIPLEDFIYSFTLLSLNLFFYLYAKGKWLVKK
ncbi:MAG: hypothetical protein FD143_2815 [Ignavibacteria bacterium]|nr:MAG: hypothetical protein FD143_2815 [Ignavibacteria bacterium]KAF0155684.1 MAG: hypothetical protein FD188_3103 [Ignavibacteria bacterium]